MLKVKWGKRAFRIFIRQWRWEGDNVGIQADIHYGARLNTF